MSNARVENISHVDQRHPHQLQRTSRVVAAIGFLMRRLHLPFALDVQILSTQDNSVIARLLLGTSSSCTGFY